MKTRTLSRAVGSLLAGSMVFFAVCAAALAQSAGQGGAGRLGRENNPNYLPRNPFYFEGKVDYELLGIDEPANAWEFMQRGIHRQDALEDYQAAITDYRAAHERNNVGNGTCQIVTSVPPNFAQLAPPPCIFTLRLRLGYLLLHDDPAESVRLFQEVLEIDPFRLEVNLLIAEAYEVIAEEAETETEEHEAYEKAIAALHAELALTPLVNSAGLSPDEANNPHVHWLLAEIYEKLDDHDHAIEALENYLKATKWHSDVLPWRIPLARKKLEELAEIKSSHELREKRRPVRGRVR